MIPVLKPQKRYIPTQDETTPTWYDQYQPIRHSKKRNVITIRRDNRYEKCGELPVISVPNLRSLFPKLHNFTTDIRMRSIAVALCSETWHKEDKKKHRTETERILYMEGLKFLSTPRPPGKRGGGCGIVCDLTKFTLDRIDINNEHKLEICWGILRPKDASTCSIKEYVVAAFYCPPKSKKKEKLITHIIVNTHKLLTKYPNCGFFIGGDKNSLNLAPILLGLPKFRQVVVGNTHGEKCLDVLITNIASLYHPPEIVPAVPADDPTRAKPSDHLVPVMYPISGASGTVSRTYTSKLRRPMPDSAIRDFGQWLVGEKWSGLAEEEGPDAKWCNFNALLKDKFEEHFPQKEVKISNEDLPFIDWKLKKLKRQLMRKYQTDGKSSSYERLLKNYEYQFEKASKEYIRKNVADLKSVNPARAASILKRLGGAPGDCADKGDFTVLSHLAQNLSAEECTASILKYFTDISKEYEPLDICRLPVRVKVKLLEKGQKIPTVEDYQVYETIQKAKKTSGVPGDLPAKLVKEFAAELATPLGVIFRSILETYQWPLDWAIEHGIALKKVKVPETEAGLRIVSLTAFWSKCMEAFVIDWLNKAIGDKIDFSQYGGLKGQSTSHYLIDLVNFVLFNQDLRNPQATLALMIDFSKAFNRQDHNTIITILSDMGTPGWLLKLVMAFLTNRKMLLKFKGCTSEMEDLPGGGPQGTKLGLFLFLILINNAGFKPNQICQKLGKVMNNTKRVKISQTQEKYIDDMTQCVSIDLKKVTHPDPNPIHPRQFHQRTGHILPIEENPIIEQLEELKRYAKDHGMKINVEKTKIMLFNKATSVDILPQVEITEGHLIELVDEMKLLGIMITSDLKWKSNTKYMVARCYQKMWMLRNLKKFGAGEEELLEVYYQQIRNTVEMACPVWNPGLSQQEIRSIERVQRTAMAVIRAQNHTTYREALSHFNIETLEARREALCLKFSVKAFKHPKFTSWFVRNEPTISTRSNKCHLKHMKTRTRRFKKSPIPYLTGLLDTYLIKKRSENITEWTRIMTHVDSLLASPHIDEPSL